MARITRNQKSGATINLIDHWENYSVVSFIASLYSGGGRVMLAEEGPLIFSIHKPNSFGSAAWNRYSAPFAKLERYLLQLNSVLTLWKWFQLFLKRSIEHKPQPKDILPLGVVHSHFSFTAVEIKCGLTVDEAIVKKGRLGQVEVEVPSFQGHVTFQPTPENKS